MELIPSFRVNHLQLLPGLYVSRKDAVAGAVITTLDLRMTAPNREPAMEMPAVHTIEHLGATWLRGSAAAEQVIYFGPMGCRTGFYLILAGDWTAEAACPLVADMCDAILSFSGAIPGASPAQCGNYLDQNLEMAKYYIGRYARALNETPRFSYPDSIEV